MQLIFNRKKKIINKYYIAKIKFRIKNFCIIIKKHFNLLFNEN